MKKNVNSKAKTVIVGGGWPFYVKYGTYALQTTKR